MAACPHWQGLRGLHLGGPQPIAKGRGFLLLLPSPRASLGEPRVIQLAPGHLLPTGTRVLTPSHGPHQLGERGPGSSSRTQPQAPGDPPLPGTHHTNRCRDVLPCRVPACAGDETKGGNVGDGDGYPRAFSAASRTAPITTVWDCPLLPGPVAMTPPEPETCHL